MDIKKLTTKYHEVKAAIDKIDAIAKKNKAPLQEALTTIQEKLLAHLQEQDLESVGVPGGTWEKTVSTSYKIADKDAFADFLRDKEDAGDYLQATIIKSKAQEMDKKDELPEFVSVFKKIEVKFKPKRK